MSDATVRLLVYGFVGLIVVSGLVYLVPEFIRSRKTGQRRREAIKSFQEKEQV